MKVFMGSQRWVGKFPLWLDRSSSAWGVEWMDNLILQVHFSDRSSVCWVAVQRMRESLVRAYLCLISFLSCYGSMCLLPGRITLFLSLLFGDLFVSGHVLLWWVRLFIFLRQTSLVRQNRTSQFAEFGRLFCVLGLIAFCNFSLHSWTAGTRNSVCLSARSEGF